MRTIYPEIKNERTIPRKKRMTIRPHGIAFHSIFIPSEIFFGSTTNWMSENGRARTIKIAQRIHVPPSASCA